MNASCARARPVKVLLIQKMAGIAGSENYFLNLLPRMVTSGIEAHFLCVQKPGDSAMNLVFARTLEEAGVKVHLIDSAASLSFRLIRAIHRLIRTEHYDIVQTNLIHADVWGAIIKRFLMPDMVLVSVKHGYSESYQARHGLDPAHVGLDRFSLLTRWAGRKADRIVTISQGLRQLLTGAGLADAAKCRVIPYGFSFDDAVSSFPAHAVRFGEPQLLIVGRLVEVKQHRLVLDILPELVRRFPRLKLVIVGAGPLEGDLKALAEARGIADSVEWQGFRKNVHDYFRASDVLVLPSAAEGFGLVILEAWHNKIPVLAFDVPAPNEIICDGETGVLVPPFDTAALLDRLSSLLSDPATARAMGERGQAAYRDRYTLDVMHESTLALYREVLEERRRTPA